MPSLIERVTQFSRSKQGRSLIQQVQNRLAGERESKNKTGRRKNRSR